MWQRAFVEAVLRHRWVVVALVAIVSIAAAIGVSRLRFETDLQIWFLENDPTLTSYRRFQDRFEADRIGVVAIVADDVFRPRVLALIQRVTRQIERAPHVSRVLSLATARIARSVDGGVEISDFIERLPETERESDQLRRLALEHPILSRGLVAADGRAAAIMIELKPEANRPEPQRELVAAVWSILAENGDGSSFSPGEDVRFHFAGSPVLAEAMIEISQRDFATFGPLGVVLLVAVGFLVFRRVSAALVPLPVVLLAVLWTFGAMGALGIPVTVVSPMLVMLILAVGVADTIHVLADYYRHLTDGEKPREAVARSVSELLAPCFCTSATTIGGLLSLRVSQLGPLREFGTLAAAGVAFAFILSVTLVPVILRLARAPDPAFVERQRSGPLLRVLDRLGRREIGESRKTLVIAGVLVVLAVVTALQVDVVANPLNFFKESHPMRRDTAAIDRSIGATASVEFLVETDEGGLQDPAVLSRLDDFERWLEQRPGVTSVLGVVDVLKDLDRVMRDVDEGRVPESRALAAQYFLLLEGEDDLDRLVQSNYSVGRITARVKLTEADEVRWQLPVVDREIGERFDEQLKVEATGFVRLLTKMDVYLIRSQLGSLSLAIVVITLIMIVILRSVRLGLFSAIPNLAPVLFGIAFMAIVGIALDQGTVMVPSIALGLVVDDAVHFLYRYRAHVKAGQVPETALHRAMTEAGRPILVTSVILSVGFCALVTGSFNPAVYFGLISAVVVLGALVATLVLLPAALIVFRPKI